MNDFIEGLKIMAPFYENGLETKFFMEAEHDIIYFHVSVEDIPEDSETGKRLQELGFHFDDGVDAWAKCT